MGTDVERKRNSIGRVRAESILVYRNKESTDLEYRHQFSIVFANKESDAEAVIVKVQVCAISNFLFLCSSFQSISEDKNLIENTQN